MEWAITITPIPGSQDCKVTTPEGEWIVKGLALFGDGNGPEGNLFSFYWNDPVAAATALVRSCAESIRREDPFALKFYRQIFYMFSKVTGIAGREITVEDALRKFEAQAVYDAVTTTDKKDWN